MIGSTYQQLFLLGANELATMPVEFGVEQQAAGFTQDDWNLLTADQCWTKTEQMKIGGIIANAVSITLVTAGIPAIALPGAYVAACICKLVQPCNRLLAAYSAPESFDIMSASGLDKEPVTLITTKEQMCALVVYFSSAEYGGLANWLVTEDVQQAILLAQNSES